MEAKLSKKNTFFGASRKHRVKQTLAMVLTVFAVPALVLIFGLQATQIRNVGLGFALISIMSGAILSSGVGLLRDKSLFIPALTAIGSMAIFVILMKMAG